MNKTGRRMLKVRKKRKERIKAKRNRAIMEAQMKKEARSRRRKNVSSQTGKSSM